MHENTIILVDGAGGFIGGHLIKHLLNQGHTAIRAVDIKPTSEWYQVFDGVDNRVLDLQEKGACDESVAGCRIIYNLACDMGGMGFIENNRALCMLSVLINTHLLAAAKDNGVDQFFSLLQRVFTMRRNRKIPM